MAEAATEMQEMPDNPVLTAEEAADLLSSFQNEEEAPAEQDDKPAEKPAEAASEEEPADDTEEFDQPSDEPLEASEADEDVAPPEKEASDEKTKQDESDDLEDDDLPIIDPPKSLSKTDRDMFRSLPREAQQRWAEIEDTRMRDITRRQSETDQERRALEAERERFNQVRQQYEAALPQTIQALQSEFAEKFPDVKTEADVQRLAAQDPNRYIRFDALMKKYQRYEGERSASEQRQQQEAIERFQDYTREQDARFLESFPDWGDAEQAPKLRQKTVGLLEDVGFTRDEIVGFWEKGAPLSARDHRFQGLIAKLVTAQTKLERAEAAVARAKAKPKQPSNRPGSAPERVDAKSQRLKALKDKADKSGSMEDALAYMNAMDEAAA